MKIDLEDLILLRKQVEEAYYSSLGQTMDVTGTVGNPSIKALRADIKKRFNRSKDDNVFTDETFIKFFLDDKDLGYQPNTIKLFKDYVAACKPKADEINNQKSQQHIPTNTSFAGADRVDASFKKGILASTIKFTPDDFFLAKQNDDCQWYGVIKNWDAERNVFSRVKAEAILSFNRNSRVSLVIYGVGGCGKSTFLRRLALECIPYDFKVLWINDLAYFYRQDLATIADNKEKYLVFIEDWTSFESNTSLTNEFLNSISKTKNIRLIIGDRGVKKEYGKYLFGQNVFQLMPDENETIIKKVLDLIPTWKQSSDKILSNSEFYNSPLFIILFVLAYTNETAENNSNPKTQDVASEFLQIARSDQNKLFSFDRMLLLILYYYACMFKKYHFPITWQTFLDLVDWANDHDLTGKRLFEFDRKNPICKILSHYISIRDNPSSTLSDKKYVYFHHDLLVDIFTNLSDEVFFYNDAIEFDLMEILTKRGEILSYDPVNKKVKMASWVPATNLKRIMTEMGDEFAYEAVRDSLIKLGFPMPD